jgi:hypothetical protein
MKGATAQRRIPKEYKGRARTVLLAVAVVLLVAITVALIIVGLLTWASPLSTADRLGLAANEIAGATFALAVLASIFAILAYAVSTRTPKIEPVLIFPNCQPNKPVVSKAQGDNAPGTPLQARVGIAGPLSIEVGLDSQNRWAAAHVTLRIRLVNMTLPPTWQSLGWERAYGSPAGAPIDTFQLREPLALAYGQIYQHFLTLDFTGLRLTGERPLILMWVAADGGYLRIAKVAVEVTG